MGISHISVNFRLWHKSCYRIDNYNIDCSGTHHGLGDLKCLLSAVRLGNIEIVNINTDILCIDRIKRMLCVNESGNSTLLLHLCHTVQCNGSLTTGLRSVNLNDTSFRKSSESQCNIQTEGSCRNRFHVHICGIVPQLHHRSFAILSLDLCDCRIQCF